MSLLDRLIRVCMLHHARAWAAELLHLAACVGVPLVLVSAPHH